MMRTLFTGTAYVVAVFAAGFVLGVLRTLVLVPLLGELAAVLVELPVILTIAWLVCTRILRRWPLSPPLALGMGAIAFLLLMAAEVGLSTLMSKDIDIFVPDPHYLGFVTPRLSDTAADLTQDYTEMAGSFVKLQFDEGEIDFVAAPNLLEDAWETWEIMGRTVKVETAAEIIAKKMYHRGDRVTARDLFDLSLVVERDPDDLVRAAGFLVRHREKFLDQISKPGKGLLAVFEAIAVQGYQPSFEQCVSVTSAFLNALPSAAPD